MRRPRRNLTSIGNRFSITRGADGKLVADAPSFDNLPEISTINRVESRTAPETSKRQASKLFAIKKFKTLKL